MPNPNIATALTALFEELLGSAQDVRIAAQHTPQFMQALDAEMADYRARFEALIAPAVDTSAMLVATKAAVQPATAQANTLLELAQVVYGHRILAAAGLFDSAEDEDEILRDLREAEEKLADHVLGLLGLSPKRC